MNAECAGGWPTRRVRDDDGTESPFRWIWILWINGRARVGTPVRGRVISRSAPRHGNDRRLRGDDFTGVVEINPILDEHNRRLAGSGVGAVSLAEDFVARASLGRKLIRHNYEL